MKPQFQLFIEEELKKLLQVSLFKSVEIIDLISPIIFVKKKNDKLRVGIDYRKINKHTQRTIFSFFLLIIF